MNEKEGTTGTLTLGSFSREGLSIRSDALKDVLLHWHCPGRTAPELHCLVKFILNNGDLELLSHICVPAREGTIGFYMEQ